MVTCCFGIGKVTVLKLVRSGHSVSLLGQTNAPMPAVIKTDNVWLQQCKAVMCSVQVMSYHVMACHGMSWHVMSYHVMSCHVKSCHVMSSHVMSCHVMSCHVMSCHVMSCTQQMYKWKKQH